MSILIHDGNFLDVLNDLAAAGASFGAEPRKTQYGALSIDGVTAVPMASEAMPLLPESRWKDAIREATANGIFIGQRWRSNPQADYQNGYKFCWAYSLAQSCMAVRGVQGQSFMQLSPESLAEDVGYRNRGNSLDSALKYAATYGIASRATVPQFKIQESQWNPEYKEDRKKYIPLEWWDCGDRNMMAEAVTALCTQPNCACYAAYNWAGHAVMLDMLRIGETGEIEVHTPNSHGPGQDWWLRGNKAVPSELYILRSVTWAG